MYSDVFFIQNSWFIQHGLWANTAHQIAHSSHVLTHRVLYYSLSNKIELKRETTIYLFASGITVIKKFKIQKKLFVYHSSDGIPFCCPFYFLQNNNCKGKFRILSKSMSIYCIINIVYICNINSVFMFVLTSLF